MQIPGPHPDLLDQNPQGPGLGICLCRHMGLWEFVGQLRRPCVGGIGKREREGVRETHREEIRDKKRPRDRQTDRDRQGEAKAAKAAVQNPG